MRALGDDACWLVAIQGEIKICTVAVASPGVRFEQTPWQFPCIMSDLVKPESV